MALLADGRLQADETGGLSTASLRYASPVEAAVLDAVGRRARRSIGTVRFRAAADERLTAVADGLAAAGLVRRARRPAVPRRGRPAWVLTGAGRAALRDARLAADGTVPPRVALDGVDALPDRALRSRVFEPPRDGRRIGGGYLDLRRAQAESVVAKGYATDVGGGNAAGGP